MFIGIIGENCSGKSTLAEKIQSRIGGEIVTGKDYLRLAKSKSMAAMLFRKKLEEAVAGQNIIYVISEKEHIGLLPDGAIRILVRADLETIRERFREQLHGNLPAPVAQMLERKHGMFDDESCDYRYESGVDDPALLCDKLQNRRS